jgi:hypothetical protein
MKVDDNSTIALEFDQFKKYTRDFSNYVYQQKISFPMTYYEYRQSRNREIVNNFKKRKGL